MLTLCNSNIHVLIKKATLDILLPPFVTNLWYSQITHRTMTQKVNKLNSKSSTFKYHAKDDDYTEA